jgi:phospholipid/cholesterol/gamma-HCH transport system substrate-binding protein
MSLGRIAPVLEELQKTSGNITKMTVALSAESKELPALTRQIKQTLASLSGLLIDLKRTTKDLPEITKSVSQTTENMPSLVLQSQETMRELEKLIKQLQNHWLMGKAGGEQEVPKRISPVEAGR